MQLALSRPLRVAAVRLEGQTWLQVAVLCGVWALAELVVRGLGLPLPGSVAGLLVVWLALDIGWLPLGWVERGADRLLDHLMLFFVPAMLALVDHPELLSWLGVKLLLVVLAGTIAVMAGTALIVEAGFRWSARESR